MTWIDPSFREAWDLAVRPFTSELGEGWHIVRWICVVFGVLTLALWVFAMLTPPEGFERPRQILVVSGWVTFLMFAFTYIACCLEAYTLNKLREEEKVKKTEEFK